MSKLKEHLDLSKNIIKCKKCKRLCMIGYLDNKLCKECDKEYTTMLNKILFYI
jgi:hypothetical protein